MIKFKILELAEGASHLLAVTKSKAEAIISEYANALGFNKNWKLNEFDVRMQANQYATNDWIVRLWLSGGDTSIFYDGFVIPPCPCRSVNIVESSPIVALVALDGSTNSVANQWYQANTTWGVQVNGEIVATISGSYYHEKFTMHSPISVGTWPIGSPNAGQPILAVYDTFAYSNWIIPGGPTGYMIKNGTDIAVLGFPQFSTYVTPVPFDLQSYASGAEKRTRVIMSDGEELASAPLIIHEDGRKENYSPTKTWNGDGYLDLYTDSSPGTPVISGRLNFAVPADACLSPPPPSAVSLTRERARLKTCHDNTIALLDAGFIPFNYYDAARDYHPGSARSYTSNDLMVKTITSAPVTTVLGTIVGANITKDITRVVTNRVTTISYGAREQVLFGSRVAVTQPHLNAANEIQKESVTTTYVDWFDVDVGSIPVPWGDHVNYNEEFPTEPLFVVGIGGTPPRLIGGMAIRSGVVVSGWTNAKDKFDSTGNEFDPPYPQATSPFLSYPFIVSEYRAEFPQIFQKNDIDPLVEVGTNSSITDEEIIEIIPLSVLHPTYGDLGMFAQDADTGGAGLQFSMFALYQYSYSYVTGRLTFVKKQLAADANGTPAPVLHPYFKTVLTSFHPFNSLFRAVGAKYADIVVAAKEQNRRLASTTASLDEMEQLYKAAKQAFSTVVDV